MIIMSHYMVWADQDAERTWSNFIFYCLFLSKIPIVREKNIVF